MEREVRNSMNLRQKLRAVLGRDRGEMMYEARRMPACARQGMGLERQERPALRSLSDYMALRRKEAEMA